jgi:hypothetical protein
MKKIVYVKNYKRGGGAVFRGYDWERSSTENL